MQQYKMTAEELFQLHRDTCSKLVEVMEKKNHDYTGGSTDVFANFTGSLEYDVHPVIGILIRTKDKFKRIHTFVKKGSLKVSDESVFDAIDDSINYLILAKGILKEEMRNSELIEKVKVVTKLGPML